MAMKAYSSGFKADAVALYLSDPARTYASVAKDLGVNRETLRLWVREARSAGASPKKAGPAKKPQAGPVASDAVLEEEGGFNWPSQHLDRRRMLWPKEGRGRRFRLVARRCSHRDGPRSISARSGNVSGG